jgi:hypothetical protein
MAQSIPIACTLDQAGLPARASLMEELGRALVAVDAEGLRASLRFEAERARLDEFVGAESACCSFFEFEVTADAAATTLRVGAPEGAEWAVRGLVAGFVAGWGGLV